jgi:hypothetical protein
LGDDGDTGEDGVATFGLGGDADRMGDDGGKVLGELPVVGIVMMEE